VWNHQPEICCAALRSRKITEESTPIPSVWFQCTDNLSWHHGPEKTRQKQTEGSSFPRDIKHAYAYE
jgi:hypothetical protein